MRLLAMLFGQKIRHMEVNTRKYKVQYFFKGKWY